MYKLRELSCFSPRRQHGTRCRVPQAIFANMLAGNPTAVSKFFGTATFSITNIIFITESLSTLDSTFTSAAKLLGPEFFGILETGRPQPPQTASKRWSHLQQHRLCSSRLCLRVCTCLSLLSDPQSLDQAVKCGSFKLGSCLERSSDEFIWS